MTTLANEGSFAAQVQRLAAARCPDSHQLSERIVDGFAGGEDLREIGLEQHNVGALTVALDILPAHASGEVVLGQHLVVVARIRIASAHDEWRV